MNKDILYEEAIKLIKEHQKCSASFLQRKLQIGYARAVIIMDELEENGIIGPYMLSGTIDREILIK